MTPSAGRRGRRPLQRSARLLLIANGTAACGQAALRMVRKLLLAGVRVAPERSGQIRLRAISRHSRRFGCPGHSRHPKTTFSSPWVSSAKYSAPASVSSSRVRNPHSTRSRAGPRCGRSPRPHCCHRRTARRRRPLRQGAPSGPRVPSGAGFVGTSGRAPRTTSNRSASKYRATTARANSSALLENTAIRTPAASAGPAAPAYRGTAPSCRACARRRPYQTRPASRPAAPGCGSLRG